MRTLLTREHADDFFWQDSQLRPLWGKAINSGRAESLLETANLRYCNEFPEEAFPSGYAQWIIAVILRALLLGRDIHAFGFTEKLLTQALYTPDGFSWRFGAAVSNQQNCDFSKFPFQDPLGQEKIWDEEHYKLYPLMPNCVSSCGEGDSDGDSCKGEAHCPASPEECARCREIPVEDAKISFLVEIGSSE